MVGKGEGLGKRKCYLAPLAVKIDQPSLATAYMGGNFLLRGKKPSFLTYGERSHPFKNLSVSWD